MGHDQIRLKRFVFTWHLKFDRESRLDISIGRSSGRLFQSFGAALQNALPTSVGSILTLGTSSITFLLDKSPLCPPHSFSFTLI